MNLCRSERSGEASRNSPLIVLSPQKSRGTQHTRSSHAGSVSPVSSTTHSVRLRPLVPECPTGPAEWGTFRLLGHGTDGGGESQQCVRRREDHFVSSMDSDKERWRPKQLEGAPAWDELRPKLISFCERSRSALEAELGRHPKGSHNWEIVSGAIEYCAEVIPVLENAQDWETAWAGNSDMPTGVRTWRRLSKWYRGIGRSTMSNYVTLGIQTGQIRELDVPGDVPLVKSGL
jgi:hypothetical protein